MNRQFKNNVHRTRHACLEEIMHSQKAVRRPWARWRCQLWRWSLASGYHSTGARSSSSSSSSKPPLSYDNSFLAAYFMQICIATDHVWIKNFCVDKGFAAEEPVVAATKWYGRGENSLELPVRRWLVGDLEFSMRKTAFDSEFDESGKLNSSHVANWAITSLHRRI